MSSDPTAAEIAALREQATHHAVALPFTVFVDTYDEHMAGGRIVAPVADYLCRAANLAPRLADLCDRKAAELERLMEAAGKLPCHWNDEPYPPCGACEACKVRAMAQGMRAILDALGPREGV